MNGRSTLRTLLCLSMATALFAPVARAGLADLTTWDGGRSMRATSNRWLPDEPYGGANNFDREDRIEAGTTFVLADLKGPGVIQHIWLTMLQEPHGWVTDGAANHSDMLLRIYWDGREQPDVEAPVAEFFANCFRKRQEVISMPVVVEDGDSYNCFWQMPFRKSCRIEVVNQSTKPIRKLYYNIDWVQKKVPHDTMYFCARYRQEFPEAHGKDYLALETDGPGYYVGTVMAVRTRSPSWFGEGDEKIYIDGEEQPSIRGTGTEDYFLSAWGLKTTGTPYFGTQYFDQWGIVGGHTAAYRWHIEDPIAFKTSIKVTFEHFGWMSPDENKENRAHSWNEREDDMATVAYWYQRGPSRQFTPGTTAAERMLPSIERSIVWGKDLVDRKHHGAGRAATEEGELYLESGGQLRFDPASDEDAWIEIPFTVEKKEPLRLLLELTRSEDSGDWRASVDGTRLRRRISLYKEGEPDLWEFHLLDFWPEPGQYTLRLDRVGQARAAEDGGIGVNSLRLRERRPRVAEFGYDKDKNWRRERTLYD